MPGDTIAIYGTRENMFVCVLYLYKFTLLFISIIPNNAIRPSICCPEKQSACTYHAGPGLLSDEGIPEDLGQSAHPEWNVVTVLSQ